MTNPEDRSSGELRLDAQLDALFRAAGASTPSPRAGDAAPGQDAAGQDATGWDDTDWAERADAIVEIARARTPSTDDADLFAPPPLAAEPGEPTGGDQASPPSGETPRALPTSMQGSTDRNGRSMSDETPKPPSSRRPSLKELAESVKNRPSIPSSSGLGSQRPPPASLQDTLVAMEGKIPAPPPASARGSMPSAPGLAGAGSTPPVSGPTSSPPMSSPTSGTGLAAATPVPSSVVPVSATVEGPTSGAPVSAVPASIAAGPSTQPSPGVGKPAKRGSNVGVGIGIGALGLAAAAAFALWTQSRPIEAPVAPTVAAIESAAEPMADSQPAPEATAEPSAEPEPGVIDISQLADASAAASAAPVVGGPLPTGPAPTGSAVAKNDPAKPAGPTGPGEELGDAIRNRAGGGSDTPEDAEPAAGEPSRKNVPNVPPTGAVTSAINAVKGNAKGCVAGADAPSSATVTFSSSGAVQGVSVGGWAQGKSAAACIKSAMSGARVPPFANPSYSTSVTIRP